jgi:uncharacterized protein
MQFPKQGVRVGPATHGLGVFSVRAFVAEQRIGHIRGQVIDDPAYQSDYCMELGENSALEPESPFRFLNHSCQPNCELVEVDFESDGEEPEGDNELWLEALCAIPIGAQLTIDYAWPAWAAIPCDCGAPGCRGWIVDPAQLDRVGGDSASKATPE